MNDDRIKIEQRLRNMKKFYLKIAETIDNLPDEIPNDIRLKLKEIILEDKELKQLIDSIDSNRPPRIFLVGRTGVGKSSLINALYGRYVAKVSNAKSCTKNTQIHEYKDGNKVLMEILDTRGIAESESLDDKLTAEEMLIEQVNNFSPDVAILMLNSTHRDDINSDVEFFKTLSKKYTEINKTELPIIVVINKCDEIVPSRFKEPSEYPESKIEKINKIVQNYKKIIEKNGLKINNIIAVSSLIDWKTLDGIEIDVDNIPKDAVINLQIAFDGRYGIEKLLKILDDAIQDYKAQMGLRMSLRLNEVVKRLAQKINDIFSKISSIIALSPIPVSDIYILLIIQSISVSLIALLSGRDISIDTGKEFILSIASIASAGYMFRWIAQQSSKFLNVLYPGAGSVISSRIAYTGTNAIGNAAIAYYLEDKTIEEIKNYLKVTKDNK